MLGENSLKLSQDSGVLDQYIYSVTIAIGLTHNNTRMKVKQFWVIYLDVSNADPVRIIVKTRFSSELLVFSQGRENNQWRQLIKVTHIP